jgi:hypothetical protein
MNGKKSSSNVKNATNAILMMSAFCESPVALIWYGKA